MFSFHTLLTSIQPNNSPNYYTHQAVYIYQLTWSKYSQKYIDQSSPFSFVLFLEGRVIQPQKQKIYTLSSKQCHGTILLVKSIGGLITVVSNSAKVTLTLIKYVIRLWEVTRQAYRIYYFLKSIVSVCFSVSIAIFPSFPTYCTVLSHLLVTVNMQLLKCLTQGKAKSSYITQDPYYFFFSYLCANVCSNIN